MEKITSCPECKNNHFSIVESLEWLADFDEEGELIAKNCGNNIDSVECTKCGLDIYSLLQDNDQEINFD